MKVLVLGASGMLGSAVLRLAHTWPNVEAWGTLRGAGAKRHFDASLHDRLITGVDADQPDTLTEALARVRPDLVINCVGLIKQLGNAKDPLAAIPLNAVLPHRLARLCALAGARLVHVSTDCVFSGSKGGYVESDLPDATDVYGRTKLLGEVDYPHAITLRTSIIGRELSGANALVDWFLSQTGPVRGFRRAVFSGLPTVELARVILEYVAPRPELHGVYHVSAAPINKFDLLTLVGKTFGKDTEINPDDAFVIDRSLSSARFSEATGYIAPDWPTLIERLHTFG